MGTSDPTESAPLLGDRPNAGADLEAGSSIDPRVERQKRQSRGMLHRAAVLSVAATLVLFGCVAMASVRGERSLAASKLAAGVVGLLCNHDDMMLRRSTAEFSPNQAVPL